MNLFREVSGFYDIQRECSVTSVCRRRHDALRTWFGLCRTTCQAVISELSYDSRALMFSAEGGTQLCADSRPRHGHFVWHEVSSPKIPKYPRVRQPRSYSREERAHLFSHL